MTTARKGGVTWVLDLDGVVWLGEEPIAGGSAALDRLRAAGESVLFVTNNSHGRVDFYMEKLRRVGVEARPDEVVTSAQASARLIEPGERVLVAGGPGIVEAVEERGGSVVRSGDADAVIVGWHREFDFDRLHAAMTAVRRGARLIGSNDDATYPTPDGPLPGGGSLVAAVAYASDTTPVLAGKPHQPLVDLLSERGGQIELVVGDRPSTDGLLARRVGARYALVLSGVTTDEQAVEADADIVAQDLLTVVEDVLSRAG